MNVTSSTVSGRSIGVLTAHNGVLVLVVAGLSVGLSACSEGGVGSPVQDAAGPDAWERSCWFGGGEPDPDVELTMGIGFETFEPAVNGQTLQMIVGDQGGAHVELHARMRGLFPGDPDDALSPGPHTLFTIENAAGERITALDCTFPLPYVDVGDGTYELVSGRFILIRTSFLGYLDGEQVRVRMEAQDPSGRYGVVEYDMIVSDPVVIGGPVDAGISDAGVPDASM